MLQIGEKGKFIDHFDKKDDIAYLYNGTRILFRPLTLSRAQFKGYNICGIFNDDPNVQRYQDVLSFLFTRLRDSSTTKANNFETLWTANWEGRDWLWKTFIRDKKEGGDNDFAYWICPTESNTTLPKNYVSDLAAVHSQQWMDRFVYCKLDSYVGLIWWEFNPQLHNFDLEECRTRDDLIKIMVVDVGITHPTVVLKMATNGEEIYIYDEWYKKDVKSSELGEYLVKEHAKENFRATLIDPSAGKKEQTSGESVRSDIRRNYGIYTTTANNDVIFGIHMVKDLFKPAVGDPAIYIDCMACPETKRTIEIYRWKEPKESEFDEMGYIEEPVKRDDDPCDCLRYGTVYLKKYLYGSVRHADFVKAKRDTMWKDKMEKLRFYKKNPDMAKRRDLAEMYREQKFSERKIMQLLKDRKPKNGSKSSRMAY